MKPSTSLLGFVWLANTILRTVKLSGITPLRKMPPLPRRPLLVMTCQQTFIVQPAAVATKENHHHHHFVSDWAKKKIVDVVLKAQKCRQ